MKNGLLYLLVGGVVGYLGYSYYLKMKKKDNVVSKKQDKDKEIKKEELPIEEIIVMDNAPVVKKHIFSPDMVRDYDIDNKPAQPHVVIYKGVSAPKPNLKVSDFVVNKKETEVNYSWLM